jgi:hypothetical protein
LESTPLIGGKLVFGTALADNARAMAQLPHDARCKPDDTDRANTAAVGPIEAPLFRFRLRQVFWVTTVVSILLACIVSADGITASVILLASLVVVAHLFSTSLSSRLRDRSDEQNGWRSAKTPLVYTEADGRHLPADLHAIRTTARSPWHGRGSTPLPWLRRLVASGAIGGGAAGALILILVIGHRASFAGILLGSVSLAVVGGWFSFLGASFYGIFRHGLRDALANDRGNQSAQVIQR